ncbi:MAG: DUF1559 domain-containing protein [Verrucomicrobia bacterium]|nr:DUF1559 domain-containing protein [Verrucomicrobiota bacterium]
MAPGLRAIETAGATARGVIVKSVTTLQLPVLSGDKPVARRTHCASNLRQIGIALVMYVHDHGVCPTDLGPLDGYVQQGIEAARDGWAALAGVFKCPSPASGIFAL